MLLSEDDRAQSIQIGAVLLFGILMIAFSIYQAQVIPNQNREIEFNHLSASQDDMQEFRDAIISAGQDGKAAPASVKLGTRYPARMAAAQPAQSSGVLRIDTIGSDSNTFELDSASPELTDVCGLDTVTTGATTYRPSYNYLDSVSNLTYENTVTYTNGRSTSRSFQTDQDLVDGTSIHLYPLVENYNEGGGGKTSVTLEGNKTGTETVSGSFSLIVPTHLSASEWEQDLLSDQSHVTGVDSQDGQAVKINFDDASYDIKCSPVGAGEKPSNDPENVAGGGAGGGNSQGPEVTSVSTSTQSVVEGGTFDITATIDDGGRGGSDIVAVEWYSNRSTPGGSSGSGYDMDATDGEFDQSVEDVENRSIDTSGWSDGWHELSVRGKDGNLNWGSTNTTTIKVDTGDSLPDDDSVAFDDKNGNGIYDMDADGDTFTEENFDGGISNETADLVIERNISLNNKIQEDKLNSLLIKDDVMVETSKKIKFALDDGSIDAAGATLATTGGNKIKLVIDEGDGNINIEDARLESDGDIDAEGFSEEKSDLLANTNDGDGGTYVVNTDGNNATLEASDIDTSNAELEKGNIDD